MNEVSKKSTYVSLAPRNEFKQSYNEYYNAIDFALKEQSIINIAVTGIYGSGKSSVLNSYFSNHKEINIIKISLAQFAFPTIDKVIKNEQGKLIKNNRIQKINRDEVEFSVLKGLFYSVDSNKIKDSVFQKITSDDNVNKIFRFAFALSAVVIVLLNRYAEIINNIFANNDLLLLPCVFIIIFVVGILHYFHKFLPFINTISFNSVKADISNRSIMDRNLHEIINLIYHSDAEVYIFEDLDRCNNYRVFEKLRQLCIIVNNNALIKKKLSNKSVCKSIKFIYTIRDDLFSCSEDGNDTNWLIKSSDARTKFFDFIIPIIPIATQNNCHNFFIDFRDKNKLTDINDDYILIISSYVRSLRTINNIFNEFLIYKGALENNYDKYLDKLQNQQLLTIIIFKNLYPSEFVEFQTGNKLSSGIYDIKVAIKDLLKKSEDIVKKYEEKYKNGTKSLNSQEVAEYNHAKSIIGLIENNDIAIYDELEIKKNLDSICSNEFIHVAIKNGFIDETVDGYMNYFYNNYIDENDNEFIRDVYASKNCNLELHLHNCKNVYDRLGELYFGTRGIVNYDLIEYTIKEGDNPQKLERMVDVIIRHTEVAVDIFKNFCNGEKYVLNRLIELCGERDPSFLINIIVDEKIVAEYGLTIADSVIQHLDSEKVSQIDENNEFSKFVNSNLKLLYEKDNTIQQFYINKLSINPEAVIYDVSIKLDGVGGFVEAIIDHSKKDNQFFAYYDILKIHYLHIGSFDNEFDNDNLHFIMNNDVDGIITNNINSNPDCYAVTCLLSTNLENITIDKAFIYLLNNMIDEDNVKQIILKLSGEIAMSNFINLLNTQDDDDRAPDLGEYKRCLLMCNTLLANHNVKINLHDSVLYYKTFKWNDELTDFIRRNLVRLRTDKSTTDMQDDETKSFYSELIYRCRDIDNILDVLRCSKIRVDNNRIKDVPSELLTKLLRQGNIEYDASNAKYIFEYDREDFIYYLYYNIDDFCKEGPFDLVDDDTIEKFIDIENEANEIDKIEKVSKLINTIHPKNTTIITNEKVKKFIDENNCILNVSVINSIMSKISVPEKIDIMKKYIKIIQHSEIKLLIKSVNSPFYGFLDVNKRTFRANSSNFKNAVHKTKGLIKDMERVGAIKIKTLNNIFEFEIVD